MKKGDNTENSFHYSLLSDAVRASYSSRTQEHGLNALVTCHNEFETREKGASLQVGPGFTEV